jgi:hypothetical protein
VRKSAPRRRSRRPGTDLSSLDRLRVLDGRIEIYPCSPSRIDDDCADGTSATRDQAHCEIRMI